MGLLEALTLRGASPLGKYLKERFIKNLRCKWWISPRKTRCIQQDSFAVLHIPCAYNLKIKGTSNDAKL